MLHYSVDCCLQQITVTIIPFFTYYGIIVHTREDPLKIIRSLDAYGQRMLYRTLIPSGRSASSTLGSVHPFLFARTWGLPVPR